MRVVLDTNILIRANPTVSPQGLARDLLLTVLAGPHVLVLPSAILDEVCLLYTSVEPLYTIGVDGVLPKFPLG